MNFGQIKRNFDKGFWDTAMVYKAVEKGVITAEQYMAITGQEYAGPGPEPMNNETWQFIQGIQEVYNEQ